MSSSFSVSSYARARGSEGRPSWSPGVVACTPGGSASASGWCCAVVFLAMPLEFELASSAFREFRFADVRTDTMGSGVSARSGSMCPADLWLPGWLVPGRPRRRALNDQGVKLFFSTRTRSRHRAFPTGRKAHFRAHATGTPSPVPKHNVSTRTPPNQAPNQGLIARVETRSLLMLVYHPP